MEAHTLMQGSTLMQRSRQTISKNVQHITILEGSKNTISHTRKGSLPKDSQLKAILQRIRLELHDGPQVEFLHFFWHNNSMVIKRPTMLCVKCKGPYLSMVSYAPRQPLATTCHSSILRPLSLPPAFPTSLLRLAPGLCRSSHAILVYP